MFSGQSQLVVMDIREGRPGDGRFLCRLDRQLDGTELPQTSPGK